MENNNQNSSSVDKILGFFETHDVQFDPADVEENKAISGVSYLVFLFFLPLILCSNSKFGRYNANQALLLFIATTVISAMLSIVTAILPFLAFVLIPLTSLVGLAFLLVMIICLVNTFQGKTVKIPYIGHISIIK